LVHVSFTDGDVLSESFALSGVVRVRIRRHVVRCLVFGVCYLLQEESQNNAVGNVDAWCESFEGNPEFRRF
jgi:hypothetical protein